MDPNPDYDAIVDTFGYLIKKIENIIYCNW